MKPQIIPSKDKNKILERIENLARSYTPDWSPDFNAPDFGSALALIFRDMYLEQTERLNKLPEKQRRDIINLFEPVPYGPEASRGYACFELSEGASSGVFLEEGFQLLADGPEDSEIHFETTEPVFVTHSRLKGALVYDHETGWMSTHAPTETGLSFPLFRVTYDANCNRPYFEVHDPKWLHAREGMSIGLHFETENEMDQDRLMEGLSSDQKALWSCPGEEVNEPLQVKVDNNHIWIEVSENARLSGTIRCDLIDIPFFRDIEVSSLSLDLSMEMVKPQIIMYNEELLELTDKKLKVGIKPFGESFQVFDVFMLGDMDIFCKPGTQIQLQLKMMEHLAPIEAVSDEETIKWRNVMHESELREPEPRTIRIDGLIWEYWNGIGWMPLPVNPQAHEIPSEGIWTIEFTCPADMEKAVFGPAENTYIRARISKMQNAFAPKGSRAVPLVKSVGISAKTHLQNARRPYRPDSIKLHANMETATYYRDEIGTGSLSIAVSPDEDIQKAVYLSLGDALEKGPIRFEINPSFKVSDIDSAAYKIQFYGIRSGREGWHDLPHEDETDGFVKNGLISFMAPDRMTKARRFGQDVYWLRLMPMSAKNLLAPVKTYNRNLNIRINAVRIKQKETLTAEYYAIAAIQPWASLFLSRAPILEADVWMNELGSISEEEVTQLLDTSPHTIHIENDKRGERIGVWIKWNQVKSFGREKEHTLYKGRIYTLDLELGRIRFGDGKTGRIPHSDLPEYIRVDYALGGGLSGNLAPGKINKAVTSIPFLERVYNGSPIWGGLGTEHTKQAEKRISEYIRHRGLALSSRDIEAIIEGQNRDIHDVCVTGGAGEIKISILPDAFPYQLSHFFEIKEKTEQILEQAISSMVSSQQRYTIIEPVQVAFSVNMDVVVESAGDYIKALSKWHEQLELYFHPLHGGAKKIGWEIGRLPEHSTILADLKHMLQGTELIDNVMIQMHLVDGEKRIPIHHRASGKVDLSHAIPVNGQHDVRIRISNM